MPALVNIVVVCFESAPGDLFDRFGPRATAHPVLSRLTREGIVFAHAYTTSPSVVAACGSLWTGLFPVTHGATTEWPYLLPQMPSLASALLAHEYRTAAFCADPAVSPATGFGSGFEKFVTLRWRHSVLDRARMFGQRTADRWFRREDGEARRVNLAFFRWLDQMPREEPFFAYVHYRDGDTPDSGAPLRSRPHPAARAGQHIAAVVGALEKRGHWEQTMLVVTALRGCPRTAGQDTPEHDPLSESVVRIPLLLRLPPPGLRGFVVEEFAQLHDLFPTVLHWAGVSACEGQISQGRVLVRGAEATQGPECVVVEEYRSSPGATGWRRRLWRTRQYRFVWRSDETLALFDLLHDPEERNNLVDRHSAVASTMRQQLFDWLAGREIFVPPVSETPDERERELRIHSGK